MGLAPGVSEGEPQALAFPDAGADDQRPVDGVYGLRRALVLAGAKTQMVSLWRVGDTATRELMVAYYDRLARGAGKSEGLRQVQLAFLREKKPRDRSHPRDWASFIVSGSNAPMTGEQARPRLQARRGLRGCACDSGGSGHPGGGFVLLVLAVGLVIRRRSG